MALNPPLCLGFSNLSKLANPSSNIWQITVTITPQGVNSNAKKQYDGTDVRTGDWVGSGNYGYAFQIITINSASAISLNCNVQDLNNWNLLQDPSGGNDGGGPVPGSFGYIFQLNSYGLPELTGIPRFPNAVWSDQLVGRFASTSVIPAAVTQPGFTGYTDYDLVRNIGRFAYIEDFTATAFFDGTSQTLIYTITVIGNSTYYYMNFTYSGSVQAYSRTYMASNLDMFNNSVPPPSGETNLVYRIPFSLVPTFRSGDYTVTIAIDTYKASGRGNGSLITKTIPFTLPNPDTMENPYFVSSSKLGVTGPTTTISGVKYYTGASYLSIPPVSFYVTNIYNIHDNRNFNYITFGGGGSGEYHANTLSYTNPPYDSNYFMFPSTTILNTKYFNFNDNNSMNVPINSYLPVTSTLLNAKGLRNSLTFFPSYALNTWGGLQQYIAYLNTSPNETTIPLTPKTYFGISNQERCSIASAETDPQTPNVQTNIIPFNSANLTTYDPAYNPLDKCFYASNISKSLTDYVLPTQTMNFVPGVKYLLIKLTIQGRLREFTVNFDSDTTSGISGMSVYWTNSPTNKWYDANIYYGNTYTGCSASTSNGMYSWPILFNLNDQSSYVLSGGYIYLNIEFSGKIGIAGINIAQ